MKNNKHFLIVSILLLTSNVIFSQSQTCKIAIQTLVGNYNGDCKNGVANGKGIAKGIHTYVGYFKNGYPNGKGVYYYSDSEYYVGNFLEGLKEGKGEMHNLKNAGADTLVTGYWCADEYKGKKYTTYIFTELAQFERVDIYPTEDIGNTINFEITTSSGAPSGTTTSVAGGSGYVLTINDLIVVDGGTPIKKITEFESANKFSVTYQVDKFPIKLQATLSDGKTLNFQFFKKARWTVKLFSNK